MLERWSGVDILVDVVGGSSAPSGGFTALGDEAMDVITQRFGRDAVRIGRSLVASHDHVVPLWATRQERCSPRFKTPRAEMPVVKA